MSKKILEETIESFDVFRENAPQLDFILSFCIIDSNWYAEIDEETGLYRYPSFTYVNPHFKNDESRVNIYEANYLDLYEKLILSKDMLDVIVEWIDLDGGKHLNDAFMAECGEYTMETEIEWWRNNINYFEYASNLDLTIMLFRTLRNNLLKSMRTGELVMSHKDWSKRTEIL